MSARHMALAKAFPEHFTYEPHEADAVSGPVFSLEERWARELEGLGRVPWDPVGFPS